MVMRTPAAPNPIAQRLRQMRAAQDFQIRQRLFNQRRQNMPQPQRPVQQVPHQPQQTYRQMAPSQPSAPPPPAMPTAMPYPSYRPSSPAMATPQRYQQAPSSPPPPQPQPQPFPSYRPQPAAEMETRPQPSYMPKEPSAMYQTSPTGQGGMNGGDGMPPQRRLSAYAKGTPAFLKKGKAEEKAEGHPNVKDSKAEDAKEKFAKGKMKLAKKGVKGKAAPPSAPARPMPAAVAARRPMRPAGGGPLEIAGLLGAAGAQGGGPPNNDPFGGAPPMGPGMRRFPNPNG